MSERETARCLGDWKRWWPWGGEGGVRLGVYMALDDGVWGVWGP